MPVRTIGLDGPNAKYQFWNWLRSNCSHPDDSSNVRINREELGGLLVEYLLESEHSGWDGFTSRDRTGINRMLEDLMRYYEAAIKDDPDHFKWSYFTGSVTYPGPKGYEPRKEPT